MGGRSKYEDPPVTWTIAPVCDLTRVNLFTLSSGYRNRRAAPGSDCISRIRPKSSGGIFVSGLSY